MKTCYKKTQSLRFSRGCSKNFQNNYFAWQPWIVCLSLPCLGEYWIIYLKAYNLWIFKWYLKHQLLPVVYFQVPNISILSLQTDRNHTFHCMLIYWKHASFETDNSMGFPICCNCDIHWRFFWVEWSVTLLNGYQFHCEGLQGE